MDYFTPSGFTQFGALLVATAAALPTGSPTPNLALVTNFGPSPASVLLTTAAATTTATGAKQQAVVVVASASGIVVGQRAVGAGIQPGATVIGIVGTSITLSSPLLTAMSTTTINFISPFAAQNGTGVNAGASVPLAYGTSTFIVAVAIGAGPAVLNVSVGT